MQVDSIMNHPDLVETVAWWQWGEWGHLDPTDSLTARIASLYYQTQHPGIPTTFIAMDGDEPLGSASLTAHDMETHPELTPWLASVYVTPAARARGVASALVRRVVQEAAAQGASRLYLFTENARGLYEKLGWQVIGTEQYEGLDVTIMAKDLAV